MNGNILNFRGSQKERYDLAVDLAKSDPDKALAEANLLIKENYGHAYTVVGLIFERQYDFSKALAAYTRGAEAVGAVEAWLGLARISMSLSPPDYAEALASYRHLAEDGNEMIAWLMLGVIYQRGLGVDVDLETAEGFLRRAEAQGSVPAKVHLAKIASMNGKHVRAFFALAVARVKALTIALGNLSDERLRDDSDVVAANMAHSRNGKREIWLTAIK